MLLFTVSQWASPLISTHPRCWRWDWTCNKLAPIMALWPAPGAFTDKSLCRPFTEDSSPASFAWSPMQGLNVQFIRWGKKQHSDIKCCSETHHHKHVFTCCYSPSWTGQRVIQPTTATPNCFSSVLWPLLVDKWPATHWQLSGPSSKHRVTVTYCFIPGEIV